MSAEAGDVRKIRVGRRGQYAQAQRGGEAQGRVVGVNVGQEEMVRLHGISCHEQTTCSDCLETLGAFQDGGTGETAFGAAIAHDETGNAAFETVLIEIGEQLTQALVGPTAGARQQVDEGIEDDEMGFDPVDCFKEAGKVLWEREGAIPRWVRGVVGVMDVRKGLDAGKIGSPFGEQLELGRGNVLVRGNENNPALKARRAVRQGGSGRGVSGQLQGEKGFAATVIAVQERNTRERKTILPEPADGLG
jgi:hypothetical protein